MLKKCENCGKEFEDYDKTIILSSRGNGKLISTMGERLVEQYLNNKSLCLTCKTKLKNELLKEYYTIMSNNGD